MNSRLPFEAALDKRPESLAALLEDARKSFWSFVVFIVVLMLCFGKPLFDLARLAFKSELYSHVLLVPFISLYLVWLRRDCLPLGTMRRSPVAVVPILLGLLALIGYGVARVRGVGFGRDDYLAITIFSFVCFIVGGGLLVLGTEMVRALVFPFAFLVFIIPFPVAVTQWIEAFFQHASAEAAYVLFQLSGTPVFRDGTEFRLPGMFLKVAEECSGIRSSLVLFITSLLAGHWFLSSPWKRTILSLAVIPLGIVRNAIRVFTIAMLCIHVNPKAIDSPIHHHGGPLFFLMSLVPFFVLLLWLRKTEQPRAGMPPVLRSPQAEEATAPTTGDR